MCQISESTQLSCTTQHTTIGTFLYLWPAAAAAAALNVPLVKAFAVAWNTAANAEFANNELNCVGSCIVGNDPDCRMADIMSLTDLLVVPCDSIDVDDCDPLCGTMVFVEPEPVITKYLGEVDSFFGSILVIRDSIDERDEIGGNVRTS
ncbi:hypothetical protein BLOT_011956 [Blomia tropicalis]|nr:hypothetical protein BLOT_011956 [Blomia tropicalis]